MSVTESIFKQIELLTPEQQREVARIVETLASSNKPKQPRQSLMGIFADLNIHVSEEEIAQARREMWGNFPREDI